MWWLVILYTLTSSAPRIQLIYVAVVWEVSRNFDTLPSLGRFPSYLKIMDQPAVILIGFCNSAHAELQFLKAEISKSCKVSLMDVGPWLASLADEVDVAPSEWLLKEHGGGLSNSELAELSEEAHSDMVAKNATEWLKAMLSNFDGVIALGGSALGD